VGRHWGEGEGGAKAGTPRTSTLPLLATLPWRLLRTVASNFCGLGRATVSCCKVARQQKHEKDRTRDDGLCLEYGSSR